MSKPILKNFRLRLMDYGENEGKYVATAEWEVKDFNFTIFQLLKSEITAESTKALDEMIKQVGIEEEK